MICKFTTILSAITSGLIIAGCTSTTSTQITDPVNLALIEYSDQIDKAQLVIKNNHPSQIDQKANKIEQQEIIDLDNIWKIISQSERLGDPTDDVSREAIRNQLYKLDNNQHFFDVMGTRATPYIYYIMTELEKRDMPLYLALLPIIESGYQVKVTSSQKASGLWQIMPSTGKYLGLKQNWWYDGRRDLIASTRTALEYLQQLHTRFDNWQLALAAYNSGGATVANAMKENRRLGLPTDYWSLSLPAETQSYIPKLIALETVIQSPEKYGVELMDIPNEPVLKIVDLKGQIQLNKVAELANIDYEKLRLLNAGFKRWATDPDGPHQLLVPVETAHHLRTAIAALPQEERVTWKGHTIQSGESLWTIARKYDISINLLKKTNHLETNKLRIGKNLLIPTGTVSESIISNAPVASKNPLVLVDNTYQVKSGDSLWLIARRFDIHVQQILEWNGRNKNRALKPGEELKIFLEKPILEAASL